MQLQGVTSTLAEHDIALFAVSYDPVDVLARFAGARGITFPLLSDDGGRVISEIGLLDPNMRRHHARYGTRPLSHYRGVAVPVVFVLDRAGRVAEKRFHRNRMERDAPATLLEEVLAIATPPPGPTLAARSEVVALQAYLDSPAYHRWQRHRLAVELDIASGWHVYAVGTSPPYRGLTVSVRAPEGVVAGEAATSAANRIALPGEEGTAEVHTGAARVTVPITFGVPRGTGPMTIDVAVSFQACSETDCLLPDTVHFAIPIDEAERIA